MGVDYIGKDNPDGVSLGQSSTSLVSVHGATPVVQASAITAAVVLPDSTVATTTEFNAVVTAVNAIITACENHGFVAAN